MIIIKIYLKQLAKTQGKSPPPSCEMMDGPFVLPSWRQREGRLWLKIKIKIK
jgi:hypothetical protein